MRWADHLPAWCLYAPVLPDKTVSLYGSAIANEYEKVFGAKLGG